MQDKFINGQARHQIPMNQEFDFDAACVKYAAKWNVLAPVHPKDFIMDFVLNHPGFTKSPEAAIDYYFRSGHESSEMFQAVVDKDLELNGSQSVLEFASGYGCVTRHLLKARRFKLTACDIHQEANDFNATKLEATTMESCAVPEEFDAAGMRYDLVFALSFFSHMPKATWTRWLQALFNVVKPGGYLLFTTHGPTSLRKMFSAVRNVSLDDEGFYFHADSEQKDLETSQYGTTITDNRFVIEQLSKLPRNCELRLLRAGIWWGHQDLYVLAALPSSQ